MIPARIPRKTCPMPITTVSQIGAPPEKMNERVTPYAMIANTLLKPLPARRMVGIPLLTP